MDIYIYIYIILSVFGKFDPCLRQGARVYMGHTSGTLQTWTNKIFANSLPAVLQILCMYLDYLSAYTTKQLQ